jgi:hypothetical protein
MSRHFGAIMRQQDKPWEALGMSRATWYRHGKPTKPRKKVKNVHELAKFVGASSTRSYQRMMRVMSSELVGYFHAGQLSISQADRILSSPELRQSFERLSKKPPPPDDDAGSQS